MQKSSRLTSTLILLITWLAYVLRTLTLDGQSLWRDEVDAIRFSSWPLQELLGGLFRVGHNGPLFFLLLRPWRALVGDSEFAIRYPSVLAGVLIIPLGYILSRQFGLHRRVAIIFGLLLATSPYLVWYGQEAKMYTLLLALTTLGMIAYLKALDSKPFLWGQNKSHRWWVVFVIATTLSFYTHILSPLILFVHGLIALYHRDKLIEHWRGWAISMACLTVPYIPLAIWQVPLLIQGFQSGHPFYPLHEQISLLLQLYSSGLIRYLGVTPAVIIFFLFLCGTRLPMPKSLLSNWNYRLIIIVWTVVPPLIVFLISLRVQVFEDRYLIYITPAFYLIITLGIITLRRYAHWLASLSLTIILLINVLGIWHQQNRPIKADFRAVGSYLTQTAGQSPTIMVQMPYLQHTLNYYYPTDYHFIEGLWTNDGKDAATVSQTLEGLTENVSEMWLVVAEEDAWDNRRLVRKWFESEADLQFEQRYEGVTLYQYQLRR